jgi:hypothetical protein
MSPRGHHFYKQNDANLSAALDMYGVFKVYWVPLAIFDCPPKIHKDHICVSIMASCIWGSSGAMQHLTSFFMYINSTMGPNETNGLVQVSSVVPVTHSNQQLIAEEMFQVL